MHIQHLLHNASADIPKLDINDSSYIKYTYGKNNFAVKNLWLYNFSDEMHTGMGGDYKTHFGEMYTGIYAYAEKTSCISIYTATAKRNGRQQR